MSATMGPNPLWASAPLSMTPTPSTTLRASTRLRVRKLVTDWTCTTATATL